MAGRASLITNNPLFSTPSPAGLDVRLLDGDARAVLICARDRVHQGWRLANHPLYGNFRPHQQPYRSIVLLPPVAGNSAAEGIRPAAGRNGAGRPNNEPPEQCGSLPANPQGRGGSGKEAAAVSEGAPAAHADPPGRFRAASSPGRGTQEPQPCRVLHSPPHGVAPVDAESLHFLEQALLLYQSPASKIRQSRPEDLPEIMRRDCALLDYELLKATLDSLL